MVMAETALSTSPKAVWIRCTTCLTVSPLRSPAIRTLESRISPTGLVPGRSVSRLAVADDLLHIRSELGIHHGFIAEFLCVGLGEGDGLGEEATAERRCGAQEGDGRSVRFDEDLLSAADAGEQCREIANGFGFGDANHRHSNDHTAFAANELRLEIGRASCRE